MSTARKELDATLNKLSLASENNRTPLASAKGKQVPVAESWDDEELEDLPDDEIVAPLTVQESREYPHAPPPTPISPASPYAGRGPDRFSQFADTWSPSGDRTGDRRPEKTDAVAKRLIAGALGVRAPKKTEDQKAYEKAMKENEMKRIKTEKEAKQRAEEEAAKAKAAVWDD